MTGNAATENATPMRLTGTLWKFRAKLTVLMLPAASVDATAVKYRNVSGSMGWLMAFGIDRRTYSRKPCDRRAKDGRYRKSVRTISSTRTPRCISAPMTVPIAAPRIPSFGPRTTVPSTIPVLYRTRRQAVGQEPLADDEHLADREGGGEDDRRDAHDAKELGVLRAL